jgi:tetratricopeptide (TPR) repeat protein
VSLFAATDLKVPDGSVQVIARTLCASSKPFAKALQPALLEHAGEFKFAPDKAESLATAWARAAARSPAFFCGEEMTVAEGVSWVRRKISEEKITNPEAAAPKEKVKLAGTVRGGAVVFASPGKDKTPEIRRLVFGAKPRGTRVKMDFKRRGVAGSNTENLGRVDMTIDDVILKNAMYPAGWVPFTHGDGKLQVRFFYLDPYEASFDGENVNRAAHDKAAAPAKPALARLTTDDEFADAVSGETVDVDVDDAAEAAAKPKPPPPPPAPQPTSYVEAEAWALEQCTIGEYAKAADLFEQALKLPGDDYDVRRVSAKASPVGGAPVLRDLERVEFPSVLQQQTAHYNIACCKAKIGETVAALDALEMAFSLGFDDFALCKKETDFVGMSDDVDRLLAKYKPKNPLTGFMGLVEKLTDEAKKTVDFK